jgi:hypothetical protein
LVSGGWKNSTRIGRREKGRDFARKNAEAKTKPSGRAGAWTQLDMNTLSVSWSFQLTGGRREISNGFASGVDANLDSDVKCCGQHLSTLLLNKIKPFNRFRSGGGRPENLCLD